MQIEKCWLEGVLKLSEPCSSYEGVLQERWNRIPLNTPLKMPDARKLVVLSRGIWNVEAGPDFKSAKIMIDGKVRTGDIEVHESEGDWLRHDHSRNPAYSDVILHVAERQEEKAGIDIPLYLLPPEEKFKGISPQLVSAKGKCLAQYADLDPKQVREMFICAGLERMHQRSMLILHDMIREGMEQAFRKRLFDACGFKRNRPAFRTLLNRLQQKYTEKEFAEFFEPLIWGESSLLPFRIPEEIPEDLEKNARDRWAQWLHLRKVAEAPIEWNHDFGRPLNSPERRIAGLVLFLRKFGMNPVELWMNDLKNAPSCKDFCKNLLSSLILNDEFWNSHTTFHAGKLKHPASVIGAERAKEIAVDIIMPSLRAAAMLNKDEKMMNRTDAAFRSSPKTQSNRVLTTALEKWFDDPKGMEKLLSDAASRQGVLQLYSNYCLKISCDCSACLISNTMFSR